MGRPDFEPYLQQIREDRLHGSTYLADMALQMLAQASRAMASLPREDFLFRASALARDLASTRPPMVAISNGICEAFALFNQWAQRCRVHPSLLLSEAARRVLRRNAARRRLAALRGAAELTGSVMTLSYSGSLAAALARAPGLRHVCVAESRPLMEGRSLALELLRAGRKVTLITDAQMRLFAQHCQVAAIGADAILADGSVVNKVGSHILALVAKDVGIPFVVVADSAKVAHRDLAWGPDLMEHHPPAEVLDGVPEGMEVANYYFERVPTYLITAIISERGRLRQQDLVRAVATRSRYRDALFRHSEAPVRPIEA